MAAGPIALHPDSPSSTSRDCCLLGAAISLGIAIHIRDGLVHPGAIAWLCLSIGLSAASFLRWPRRLASGRYTELFPWLLGVGLAVQFLLLLLRPPAGRMVGSHTAIYQALTISSLVVCVAIGVMPARGKLLFTLLLVLFAATGLWVLRSGMTPHIDVWTSQMAGLDAMRAGRDPWSSTFPDVYHLPGLYAAGTVRDGVVHLGFPYPPLTVLLDLPGYLIFHDFRYSNLAAMMITGALIAATCRGRVGALLAALFLFTPRTWLVLQNGWTEPTVCMALAATIWVAVRKPAWIAWPLGLLLVSKQYMPLAALPVVLLLGERRSLKNVGALFAKAALIGASVSLPLAFWNAKAFAHSTLLVAGGAQFRLDALSFFAFFANVYNWTPPDWAGAVSYLAAIGVGIYTLFRAERSAGGFAGVMATMFLVFFSLNKFAFCNYYYFVIATLCTAVAASRDRAIPIAIVHPVPLETELVYRAFAA
jgi:hypothetical protein